MKKYIPTIRIVLYVLLVLQIFVFVFATTTPVYADDCERDPLNAADCMRTTGFRQSISVIMSVGGAGTMILVTILSGGAQPPPAPPVEQVPPVEPQTPVEEPPRPDQESPPEEAKPPKDKPPEEAKPTKQEKAPEESPPEEAQPPEEAPPAEQKPPEQPGVGEQIFTTIKDLVSATSNAVGGFNEYFEIADSPEKIRAIKQALDAWRKAPSADAAKKYLDQLRKSNSLRAKGLGDKLGLLSKGLDVIEAYNKAMKVCNDRGYTGVDKWMRLSAELGKKGLGWMLTKNPVVGLADAAVGGATQMIFGPEGKIDIGSTIDKTADAWDKYTQEAADLYYGDSVSQADQQRLDNLNRYLKRIRQQVNDGKISRDEGASRMRRLIKIMR